jgi:hypothetical protein
MFQQDDNFCPVFYFLQTALRVSGETFTHHQESRLIHGEERSHTVYHDGFGGLVVCVLASNPAEAVGFFLCKNPRPAFLRRGS